MMVGIPGSGKSTCVTRLHHALCCEVVCPDTIRFELTGDESNQDKNGVIFSKIVPERIKAALKVGDVIYDAMNYNRKSRKDICILAKSLDAKVIAYVLDTPFDVCIARNAVRERVVPDFVFDRVIGGYQAPDINIEKIDEIKSVTS